MKRTVLLLLFWAITLIVSAQQTVGVLIQKPGSEDGYVLFAPQFAKVTYLIDKCGRVVHTWQSNYTANRTVNILPDGSLLRPRRGAVIERLDWNSNILWSYTLIDDTEYQSHEVYPMPNGNVLAIVWVNKTATEAINAGFNPSLLNGATTVVTTKIEEIKPIGATGGKVVWQWDAWDHLIQDYDSTKPNYGIVADHPELINLNYVGTKPDYGNAIELLHTNSVDYNADLDQVLISHRYFSEFWILDHSTTTKQAATHRGGVHNKGGDIIYRWGNPAAYNRGTIANEKEFGQHNVQWIDSGLPGAGHILAFNDGYARPGKKYSEADEIIPPVDSNGNYSFIKPYIYGPAGIYWYDTAPGFYSYIIGGVQRLVNGNTLICAGQIGTFYEVDSNKNVVWEYINPVGRDTIASQGEPVDSNFVFRCTLYQSSYPGFAGRDLTPGKPLEKNPFNTPCEATCSPTISPSAPEICSNGSIQLVVSGSNSYSWTPAIGLSSTAATTVVANPTVTTTYYVAGETGTCTGTDTLIVTVNPTPVLTISPSAPSACYGSTVALTAAGALIYSWSPESSLSDTTGAMVFANPTVTSTYTIIGISGSCTVTDSIIVTVDTTPVLAVYPRVSSICDGSSVVLTAGGAATYSWLPANSLNATTGTSVLANPSATSTYTIFGRAGACTATDSVIVTVNPAPVLTIYPSVPSICYSSNMALTASGAATYSWAPAIGLSDTTGSVVLANPTITTTYYVTGIKDVCNATDTVIVTIDTLPAKPTITLNEDTLVSGNAAGYQWFYADTIITGATDKNYVALASGWYYVTITDSNGCSSISDSINISAATSVNQLSIVNSQISIYPNPVSKSVFIKINPSYTAINTWNLQLIDVLGQVRYSKMSLSYNNAINLSDLPGGIYFITIINKNGRSVFSLMKEN